MKMVTCYLLLFVLINHYRNVSEGFVHVGFPALGKNQSGAGEEGASSPLRLLLFGCFLAVFLPHLGH